MSTSRYTKTTWVEGKTPISADKLNKIENAIEDLYSSSVGMSDIVPGQGLKTDTTEDSKLKISIDTDTINELVEHPELSEGSGIKITKIYEGQSVITTSTAGSNSTETVDEDSLTTAIFNDNTDSSGIYSLDQYIYMYYNSTNGFYYTYETEDNVEIVKGIEKIIVDESCAKLNRIYVNLDNDAVLPDKTSLCIENNTSREIDIILPVSTTNGIVAYDWTILPETSRNYVVSSEADPSYFSWSYTETSMTSTEETEVTTLDPTVVKSILFSVDPNYINKVVDHPTKVCVPGNGINIEVDSENKKMTFSADMDYIKSNIDHPTKVCIQGTGIKITVSEDNSQMTFSIDEDYIKTLVNNIINGKN